MKGTSSKTKAIPFQEGCIQCLKILPSTKNVFFVEEEIGRIFCSEECIGTYFSKEIAELEGEYFNQLSPTDLSHGEKEKLDYLRWPTLEDPEEVWMETTPAGDHRFTLISEFFLEGKQIWCVCICLCLRGEPSFLYLSFPTSNAITVAFYRKGETMPVSTIRKDSARPIGPTDSLADAWTEDETLRARFKKERGPQDIPRANFHEYEPLLEQTLKNPDEVWSLKLTEASSVFLYHFIRIYTDHHPALWYVVVARDAVNHEQIEILDAFPTQDPQLVDHYRQGTQEVGPSGSVGKPRMVH